MDVSKLEIELDKESRRKIVNNRFKLLQNIGQGQYGKVLLAQDLDSEPEKYVAIKTIHRVDTARLITKTYLSHTTKIKREIQIMKECDHPNVVKLFQVIDDMKYDKILLVLEYCALGEIDWKKYNHYHEKYFKDPAKRLSLNRILRDVANGLEYLHSYKHIIHRDLKPSNLLIGEDRTIKIADFGVSLILENNANDDRELGKTMGTPAFFAPELCQFVNNRLSSFNDNDLRRSSIDSRIDIWSLGVTLYCLFYHQLPFEGRNEFSLFKNIVNGALNFPATKQSSQAKPDDIQELTLLEELIRGLLDKEPSKRPTLAQIKRHKFTNFDLSSKETEAYLEINTNIALKSFAAEKKLTQRLRNLFISRTVTDREPLPTSKMDQQALASHAMDLEKVDDLLDSYLDDSSSFGSFDGEEEDTEAVPTSLFDSLPTSEAAHSLTTKDLKTASAMKELPPPLKLSKSNFDLPKSSHSPLSQTSPAKGRVVTIGPDSPSAMNPVFSPSRRFFLKFKKKTTEPTISSLSGKNAANYTKLAPPPTFSDAWQKPKPKSNRNSLSSLDSGSPSQLSSSRKNSMSSTASGVISRISSSSSSLNLHAYLMESPASSSKRNSFQGTIAEETGATRDKDGSSSSSSSSDEDADRTMSMDQFLDKFY